MRLLILLVVLTLAWRFQFKLDLFPEVKWAVRSGIAEVRSTIRGESSRTDSGQPQEPARQSVLIPWSETGLADQPSANGGPQRQNCVVTQTVRNNAAENSAPASVVLEFSFLDGVGNLMGKAVRVTSGEMVPAGKEDKLTFEVPCPTTLATIRVQPIANYISIRAAQPSEKWAAIDVAARRIRDGASFLAVKIPDQAMACQGEDPCTLVLSVGPERLLPVEFQREPGQPNVLFSNDPGLIQYLAGGGHARLEVPTADGTQMVGLGQENVIMPEKPGIWERFKGWFSEIVRG